MDRLTRQNLRVCYVLAYRCPNYVRTLAILAALTRIEGLAVSRAVNTHRGFYRYFQTIAKLLRVRFRENPDVYILGLRGFEIFWPVRLITRGKPLIFDQMMSPYDSLVNERCLFRRGGLLDKLTFAYERSLLRASDLVLTDTPLHRNYLSELFGIPGSKIHAVPVSTDETLFLRPDPLPSSPPDEGLLHILFYGSFLPLHGIPIILAAARGLSDQPVRFTLIGGERRGIRQLEETMKNERLHNVVHRAWVDFDQLPGWIERADLCLGGPFGDTGQGRRVITGKTFQCLAMGKSTVVGEIEGDHGFIDRDNCLLVPQGDAEALSRAILWALHHRDRLPVIGRRGQELYQRRYSIDCVKACLLNILAWGDKGMGETP